MKEIGNWKIIKFLSTYLSQPLFVFFVLSVQNGINYKTYQNKGALYLIILLSILSALSNLFEEADDSLDETELKADLKRRQKRLIDSLSIFSIFVLAYFMFDSKYIMVGLVYLAFLISNFVSFCRIYHKIDPTVKSIICSNIVKWVD